MTDIFIDAARMKGDYAGVIEVDDETAHFYLCAVDGKGGSKIVAAINMGSDICQKSESEFEIGWSNDEDIVAALVNDEVYAAFELEEGHGPELKFKKIPPSQIDPYVKQIFKRD